MQFKLTVGKLFFPPLCQTLYASYVKLFAEASELLTHALVQQVVVSKSASSGVRPSGGHRDGSWRVLYQGCGEDEDLIDLPLWPNLRICCFDFFNVSTCRSEWTVGTSVQRIALTAFGQPKQLSQFMELDGSLPCSQHPGTGHCPESH